MTPTYILAYGTELFVGDLPAQHRQDVACTLHPASLFAFQFVDTNSSLDNEVMD